MEAGFLGWMGFLSLCVVAMVVSFVRSLAREDKATAPAPQQPAPQQIDVHVHMPTGDEIGAGMVRQLQQAAAKQIEAQGQRLHGYVFYGEPKPLPADAQPRLGNQRNEIVRR